MSSHIRITASPAPIPEDSDSDLPGVGEPERANTNDVVTPGVGTNVNVMQQSSFAMASSPSLRGRNSHNNNNGSGEYENDEEEEAINGSASNTTLSRDVSGGLSNNNDGNDATAPHSRRHHNHRHVNRPYDVSSQEPLTPPQLSPAMDGEDDARHHSVAGAAAAAGIPVRSSQSAFTTSSARSVAPRASSDPAAAQQHHQQQQQRPQAQSTTTSARVRGMQSNTSSSSSGAAAAFGQPLDANQSSHHHDPHQPPPNLSSFSSPLFTATATAQQQQQRNRGGSGGAASAQSPPSSTAFIAPVAQQPSVGQMKLDRYLNDDVPLNQLPLSVSDALWRLGAVLSADTRVRGSNLCAQDSGDADDAKQAYSSSSTSGEDSSSSTAIPSGAENDTGDSVVVAVKKKPSAKQSSSSSGDDDNDDGDDQPNNNNNNNKNDKSSGDDSAAPPLAFIEPGPLLSRDASYETAESLFRKLARAFEALPEPVKRRRIVMPYEVRRAPCRLVKLDFHTVGCVCAFLEARDMESLAGTCSKLHRLLRDNEFVWQQLCANALPKHYQQQCTSDRPEADAEKGSGWRQVMKARAASDRMWFTRSGADMDVRGFAVSRGVHTVVLDDDTIYFTTSQHYEMQSLNLRTGARPFGPGIHTGHTHSITSMKIVQDFPEYIITASVDSTLRLFDRNQKQPAGEFRGHTDRIWGVDTYRELVFSGGTDRTVRMWSMQDRTQCGVIEEQHTSVSSVRVMRSQSAAYIACGSSGSSIRVWDIGNGVLKSVARFRGHQKGVYCLQDTGRLLFSGSLDNVIYGWDPRVNFGRAMSLVQYDIHGRAIVNTATSGPPLEHIGIVTFTVDDTKLVAGCADNSIRIWDLRMQRMVNELKEHSHWVTSVQFDQRKLVSTSRDRTIRIWDIDSTLGSYLHGSIGSMKANTGAAAAAASGSASGASSPQMGSTLIAGGTAAAAAGAAGGGILRNSSPPPGGAAQTAE